MSKRLEGAMLGARPSWGKSNGIGIWTPEQQLARKRDNTWVALGDPYFSSVKLLLHLDGANNSTTFTDTSTSPVTMLTSGSPVISTAQSKFGGASLSVSNSYINTANTSRFVLGSTTDFTIECWFYLAAHNQTTRAIFSLQGLGLTCNLRTVDTLRFGAIDGTAAVPTGQWNHLAIVRSGASGTFKMYLNGTQDGGTQNYAAGTATDAIHIGYSAPNAGMYWPGYIDEFRATYGVARYTSNFTVPTASFPDFA